MKRELVQHLACPRCQGDLALAPEGAGASGEIQEGELRCSGCQGVFPIKNCIPRFVPPESYANSFGLEWNAHARTQIDKFNGTSISGERFFGVTGWPHRMERQRVLEAGCGAGRFSQIAIETGAEVFSLDLSSAVEANLANNGSAPNLHIMQANIYQIPLKREMFDRVFCFGVLQHCPDVKRAFLSLPPYLKAGGEIAIDVSAQSWKRVTQPFWWLRLVTPRIPPTVFHRMVEKTVPVLQPVKIAATKVPGIGRYLGLLIPVVDYHNVFPLSPQQNREWGILDTFDALSPRYNQGQRIEDVRQWFEEAGLTNVEVVYGPNGINARGTRPLSR